MRNGAAATTIRRRTAAANHIIAFRLQIASENLEIFNEGGFASDPDVGVWRAADHVLDRIGPEAMIIICQLVKLLEYPTVGVRRSVALALRRYEPGATGVVPELGKLRKRAMPDVRWSAGVVLAQIGPAAKVDPTEAAGIELRCAYFDAFAKSSVIEILSTRSFARSGTAASARPGGIRRYPGGHCAITGARFTATDGTDKTSVSDHLDIKSECAAVG